MKYLAAIILAIACAPSMAGTLTIVPDSTSSIGIQQQKREAVERARAERQARIAAGIEQPPPVIIIKQAPQVPQSRHMDCYAYGPQKQYLSCD